MTVVPALSVLAQRRDTRFWRTHEPGSAVVATCDDRRRGQARGCAVDIAKCIVKIN